MPARQLVNQSTIKQAASWQAGQLLASERAEKASEQDCE
jgi:hypothetical protein